MKIKTHGIASLHDRRVLETDFRTGDTGPGVLTVKVEDHETCELVEGKIRLDPWIADEYGLTEFVSGGSLVICGAQAIVAVDAFKLTWLSSIALEYHEAETIDLPWFLELASSQLLVVATDRRVWCLAYGGTPRWMWSCVVSNVDRWIFDAPTIEGDSVCIPLRTFSSDLKVMLRLSDGLPA